MGGGPYRSRLRAAGRREPASADHVVLTGPVPREELPAHYAAGDVFAMPCRTRNRGLDVEGLGIVYLEASATGLPVVAGRLRRRAGRRARRARPARGPGGRDVAEVADRVSRLLLDTWRARDGRGRAGLGAAALAVGACRARLDDRLSTRPRRSTGDRPGVPIGGSASRRCDRAGRRDRRR